MIKERAYQLELREKVLAKYQVAVCSDSAKARKLIKQLNYREDPYLLVCIAQTYYDESAFYDDGTPREYFEGKKLRLAEKYMIRAFILNEDCIDVLYLLGKVRKAFRQYDLAIYCFKRLRELSRKVIPAKDKCTNHSLVKVKANDSRFQLYRIYHALNERALSKKYMSQYKTGLNRGVDTIFKPLEKFLLDWRSDAANTVFVKWLLQNYLSTIKLYQQSKVNVAAVSQNTATSKIPSPLAVNAFSLGFLSEEGSSLISKKASTWQGYTMFEYEVNPGKTSQFKKLFTKLVFVGTKVYAPAVFVNDEHLTQKDREKFFGSFSLQ